MPRISFIIIKKKHNCNNLHAFVNKKILRFNSIIFQDGSTLNAQVLDVKLINNYRFPYLIFHCLNIIYILMYSI